MNQQQFQTLYHEYQTHSPTEAANEAAKVNLEAEDFQVEAVDFGSLGWGLMLKTVVAELRPMNIIPDLKSPDHPRPLADQIYTEALRASLDDKVPQETPQTPTPKWTQSPTEIADEIADNFYPVASIFHADLRREIIKAIEAERIVTTHYMTQMGCWGERLQS